MAGQAIITIRDKQWQVSLADAPWELAQGLGELPELAPGTGMLFDTGWTQIIQVTTVPMLFPIDIAFLPETMVVSEVYRSVEPGYVVTSTLPARYFLEVNAGELEGIDSGDRAAVMFLPLAGMQLITPDWTSAMAGFMVMAIFMTAVVKGFIRDAMEPPKERPVLYGPRGERLLAQTRARGKYEIDTDYMGNIIITRTDDPDKDVFLQFEADKSLVYDPLKKEEREDLNAGWSITIKRSEPRASVLDELWGSSAQRQSLPQTKKRKPARDEIEIGTWVERDRIGIWLTDKRTGKTVAEWWDEDAREMFEQGWFKPGDIRHQTITGRAFEESVLDYAESVGILTGSSKHLPQTTRMDAYYWTAVNKDTGEIVESFMPYTSSGRALRGGRAYASRHWRGDRALVEVWRQPYRYSENLRIQPVASEVVTDADGTFKPGEIVLYKGERVRVSEQIGDRVNVFIPSRQELVWVKPEALKRIEGKQAAVVPTEPRQPRPHKEGELEFLPDSPEFLAYTIDDIGYREKIDTAFQQAIKRAKGLK